jgi:hypothetical protein
LNELEHGGRAAAGLLVQTPGILAHGVGLSERSNDRVTYRGENRIGRLGEPVGELDARIQLFASLRLDALDSLALKRRLDEIGSTTVPTASISSSAE